MSRVCVCVKKIHSLWILYQSKLSISEQVYFAKRLAFLLRAGVPILDAVRMIQDGTRGKHKFNVFSVLLEDLSNGILLSNSILKIPGTFSNFLAHIIRVGETSGTLSSNLEYVSVELKKKQLLRRKVLSALLYPLIVVCGTVVITSLLLFYIFPKILPIFKSMNITLPVTTRIVIVVSDILMNYFWVLVLLGVVFFFAVILVYRKLFLFKMHIHKILFSLPVIGKIIKSYVLANFCRTFGLLLKSGVEMRLAFSIIIDTTHNPIYRSEFSFLKDHVAKGSTLSHFFQKKKKLFDQTLIQMIAVGEATGNLSEVFLYTSTIYEEEVDEFTKNISTLIEPFLMIIMGVIVGFVAISIITPIYEVTQHLQ